MKPPKLPFKLSVASHLSIIFISLRPALSPARALLFDASAFMMGNNKNSKVCEPTGKLGFIPLTETVNVQ